MRRADRLFEILQFLRGGRLRTARDIAEELEVSTRTIWRDIADLQAQGVPIDGERGVGYVLRESFFLPPLALTSNEMEALLWGTRLVETFGDDALAKAARELHVKIATVSPEERRISVTAMAAFASPQARAAQTFMGTIRKAIEEKRKLSLTYLDLKGSESNRVVRPLNLEFWGQVWTLTAWCEVRANFRAFRCDRLSRCVRLEDRFREEKGKRFVDFLSSIREIKPDA